ncbi:hypothetical protein ACO0K9_22315 [Undibacterium sp. Ji50W]|uniref:hypothetical protein n=1 Tax=Undibacterium sp. Ji50W TaxID=3413041 RepID=UPI003BF29468
MMANADYPDDDLLQQLNIAPLLTALIGLIIAFMIVFSSHQVWELFQGFRIWGCYGGGGILTVDVTVNIKANGSLQMGGHSFDIRDQLKYIPQSPSFMTEIHITLLPVKKVPYNIVMDIAKELEQGNYTQVEIAGDKRFNKEFPATIERRKRDEIRRETRFSAY